MKIQRHNRILKLIELFEIETQEELCQRLQDEGFNVTQATISRDIRDLKLGKMPIDKFKSKYVVQSRVNEMPAESNGYNKQMVVFAEAFVSSDCAQNICVVKTLVGMASAVAAAIDSLNLEYVLGSIAGDDCIMIICRNNRQAEELVNKCYDIVNNYK